MKVIMAVANPASGEGYEQGIGTVPRSFTVVGEVGAAQVPASPELGRVAVEALDISGAVDWKRYVGYETGVVQKIVSSPPGTQFAKDDIASLFPNELGPGLSYLVDSLLKKMSKDKVLGSSWVHNGEKKDLRRWSYEPPVDESEALASPSDKVPTNGNISSAAGRDTVGDEAVTDTEAEAVRPDPATEDDFIEARLRLRGILTPSRLPPAILTLLGQSGRTFIDTRPKTNTDVLPEEETPPVLKPKITEELSEQVAAESDEVADEQPASEELKIVEKFEPIAPVKPGLVEIHPDDWLPLRRRTAIVRVLNPEVIEAKTLSLPEEYRQRMNKLVIRADGRATMNGNPLNGAVITELMNVLLAAYLSPPISLDQAHEEYGLGIGLSEDGLTRKLDAVHKECLQLMAQRVIGYDAANRSRLFLAPLSIKDYRPKPALFKRVA